MVSFIKFYFEQNFLGSFEIKFISFYFSAAQGQSTASGGQSTSIDIAPVNITDEEKEQLKISYGESSTNSNSIRSDVSDRPFLDTVLSALDCSENDYLALLGLCLIYALANNKGK